MKKSIDNKSLKSDIPINPQLHKFLLHFQYKDIHKYKLN